MRVRIGLLLILSALVSISAESQVPPTTASTPGATSGLPSTGAAVGGVAIGVPTLAVAADPYAGMQFGQCEDEIAREAAAPSAEDIAASTRAATADPLSALFRTAGGAIGGAIGGATTRGGDGAASGLLSGTLSGTGATPSSGGLYASCPRVDTTAIDASCENARFRNAAGVFEEARLREAIAEVEGRRSAARCAANQARNAGRLGRCFEREMTSLRERLGNIGEEFQRDYETRQQYLTQLDTEVQEEEQRGQQIEDKTTQMQETLTAARAVLNRVYGRASVGAGGGGSGDRPAARTLSDLRLLVRQHQDMQRSFELSVRTARANRVGTCFRGHGAANSALRACADSGGNAVGPRDCILNMYRDARALEYSGGSTRVDPAMRRRAENDRREFERTLDRMTADFAGLDPRTTTARAFADRNRAELSRYGAAGQAFLTEVESCATEVNAALDNPNGELHNPNEGLGREAAALRQTAETVASEVNQMLVGAEDGGGLEGSLRSAYEAMFGVGSGANIDALRCARSSSLSSGGSITFNPVAVEEGIRCAEGMAANLRSLIEGTVPPGAAAPISADTGIASPTTGANIRCSGLATCISLLGAARTASRNLVTNMRGTGTYRRPGRCAAGCPGRGLFIRESNRMIREGIRERVTLLRPRIAVANAQWNRLRELMGRARINIRAGRGDRDAMDTLCPSGRSEELCSVGSNIGDRLATGAGLPDINDSTFETMSQEAERRQETTENDVRTIGTNLEALQGALATCRNQAASRDRASTLDAVGRRRDRLMTRCRTGTGGRVSMPTDFGSSIERLQSDMERVCRTATSTEDRGRCTDLSESLANASSECQGVVDEARRRDENECEASANARVGSTATGADRTSAFNEAYQDCLRRRGRGEATDSAR